MDVTQASNMSFCPFSSVAPPLAICLPSSADSSLTKLSAAPRTLLQCLWPDWQAAQLLLASKILSSLQQRPHLLLGPTRHQRCLIMHACKTSQKDQTAKSSSHKPRNGAGACSKPDSTPSACSAAAVAAAAAAVAEGGAEAGATCW